MVDCVLVTAIGSFSAERVIKNLKSKNIKVIGCDIYAKELVANSIEVDEFYQSPYANTGKEYIEFLLNTCKKCDVKYIFPLTDIEIDIINENRDCFEKNGIVVCFSSKETIDICRNKKVLEETLSKVDGIPTIPTYYASEFNNKLPEFPVVCKPYNGRSSQGLKYVNNEKEWVEFLKTSKISDYIVQPFFKGNVVTVDVLRQDKNVICVSRKEILRTANGAGLSVYVYQDKKLNDICYRIADTLNIKGCVNFEFIVDDNGNYRFIECNPRFSGGIAFSTLGGGMII